MAVVRKCVCCGKEYEYCPSCPKKDHPGWMVTFCSEECKELFNIISAYNARRINKEAVRKYMTEHKINVDKYLDAVKKVLLESVESLPSPKPLIKEEIALEPKVLELPKEEPREESKEEVKEEIKEEPKVEPSPTVRSISTATGNYEHRPRRNKKRRNRQLDIELN